MGDPTRQTGVYKAVDERGKESSIVHLAANLKVVVGALAATGALVVGGAAWFNGHVQAQAIKALGTQLSTDGSDVKNAFEALLDRRAEEIEKNLKEELVRNRDLETEHYEMLRSTVWRATSPQRQLNDPPPWEDDDG
jgi:hypothetical protein